MRRFIDVVFIHPKNRYYVVLHQGKFWQLARMNLTVSSWVFKLLYKGSLGDIFVARNQAVVDEKLSKILKTYDLPAELHGLNANRFLDWWEMNDYKWLSTKDVITLDALPAVTPKPVEPPKTVITPAALAILQKKRLISEEEQVQAILPSPAPAPSLPDFDEVLAVFDELTKNDHEKPPKTPTVDYKTTIENFNNSNKIDSTNDNHQLNQFDELENFDKLLNSFGQVDPSPAPEQQSGTSIDPKINTEDSLLGRFKISPQLADFTPDSAIASPIPNPPPKSDVELGVEIGIAKADSNPQPTTEPQEPMPMPQPASRPMSKLHEFNAQYAKKSTATAPERPTSVATQRPMSPLAQLASNHPDLVANPQTMAQAISQNVLEPTPIARSNTNPTPNQATQVAPPVATTTSLTGSSAEPKSRTSALDESFDIFDDLLKELTEELIPD